MYVSPKMGSKNFFKSIGRMEGASFLALLGIAMPLKYIAGNPLAVRYVGWIHGVLFVLYVVSAYQYGQDQNWTTRQFLASVAAAVLPFGPFVLEKRLNL